jgi:hypothetical protein
MFYLLDCLFESWHLEENPTCGMVDPLLELDAFGHSVKDLDFDILRSYQVFFIFASSFTSLGPHALDRLDYRCELDHFVVYRIMAGIDASVITFDPLHDVAEADLFIVMDTDRRLIQGKSREQVLHHDRIRCQGRHGCA